MLECYCDCVGVDFPFTAEDFLTEQDLQMINGNEIPTSVMVQSKNIRWQNWSSSQTHELTKSAFGSTLDETTGKYSFNGFAIITNLELKRKVIDWMQQTFHPDFIQRNWDAGGLKTPPVTILSFSTGSEGWHKEGPIEVPSSIPKDFNTEHITTYRHPAVCNFRLLGDKNGSSLEFARQSERLWKAEQELIEEFCKQSYDAYPNLVATELHDMTMTDPQHWFTNEEVWRDDLEIITEHVGMHNPYIVNINQWHRVKTNGQPRVTFRVHSSSKLTFKQIEEMFEAGKMFI